MWRFNTGRRLLAYFCCCYFGGYRKTSMSLPEKEEVRQSLQNTLKFLEKAFEENRAKTPPQYPLDGKTGKIKLPQEKDAELKRLIGSGKKIEAVRQVALLTGAGLVTAKNYVDALSAKTLTAKDIFGGRK